MVNPGKGGGGPKGPRGKEEHRVCHRKLGGEIGSANSGEGNDEGGGKSRLREQVKSRTLGKKREGRDCNEVKVQVKGAASRIGDILPNDGKKIEIGERANRRLDSDVEDHQIVKKGTRACVGGILNLQPCGSLQETSGEGGGSFHQTLQKASDSRRWSRGSLSRDHLPS